ncbi:two-component system histidine kinase PnpS [Alkaliphilus peptidifermentans]|uniref:histidine kinase n=1 Tax=Alkaliphilus peptidifermentans DSM 18978 TaxID=1120976 RepID=A0A1G5BCP9_9FIRM|nr:ATP-binding protein [Alkaliphilus peptidifermentans]SCX87913.1 PAS/PAC sensor signal transduction histidine kinase [Alkaliphilus peptidifermentans DSM 18978]
MQRKILIAFFIIMLLGILLSGFLNLTLIRTSYMDELESRLISNARLLERVVIDRGDSLTHEDLQTIAIEYGQRINLRITFIDYRGEVLADTLIDPDSVENHYDRPEITTAYEGEIGKAVRYSTTINEEMLYIALPVDFDTLELKVIRLAVNLQQIKEINQKLYNYIGVSILFGFFASLTLAYRYIRKIMEPIYEMTEVSKKIAEGDLRRRVDVSSDDEIGLLANNFNNMADRLKTMIDKLSDNNTKFKALLTSIINPIIAVDNMHHIILINPAAEKLFEVKAEDAMGKHIIEIIRNSTLEDRIKDIFENHQETQMEINIQDPEERILKIYTNLIKLENDPTRVIGIVTLLEDVTEMRKLEKMRSDFVANVSHELKTPLTSISGFVETLKSGTIEDEDTKMRFLDIIDIETERLTRLIDDILTLSEIENNSTKSIRSETYTTEAINEVTEIMRPIADGKKIDIITEVEGNLPIIYGNRDWFKQMLINLLDNAIKYTPQGGRVQINAYQKYNHVVIVVKDSGLGIPKNELPRLFERFYRVDKARSKKVIGTGLGLAIVKHIVLAFNGRIKVNSEVGKGTEFTIIIPTKIN